jgi:hypothetical protein
VLRASNTTTKWEKCVSCVPSAAATQLKAFVVVVVVVDLVLDMPYVLLTLVSPKRHT